MKFIVNGKTYELYKVDEPYGYDIYEGNNQDPINLGEVAYFDHEPTQEDVESWIADFQ
jgi:hypothetical protein